MENTKDKDVPTRHHPPQKLYTELGNDDVLLGRGTGPNEFEGNIRFRQLVGELAMATDPKNLLSNKPVLARKVVEEVANRGGRFVRKLSKGEVLALANITPINKRKDFYVEVPHAVAIEKAKQSFRHQEKVLLDRRAEGPSRATKGLVGGALLLKSPPALSIKDDCLSPPDKHSRLMVGIKPKDNPEKGPDVRSSSMTEKSDNQASLEAVPIRSDHSAVSLPSSLYSNILSQSHSFPNDTTSLLASTQQQSSAQLSGPHTSNVALTSSFPLLPHGILDPSSLLHTSQTIGPNQHLSDMDILNEVSRRHDLSSLLGPIPTRRAPLSSSTPSESRTLDVRLLQQQSQTLESLLQLLQEYYSSTIPASLSSRASLPTSLSSPRPPPPWSSPAALGLIGGSVGTNLVGGSIDLSRSNLILQQHLQQHQDLQQQQVLLASLGGALGLAQDSREGSGGASGVQQAGSLSGRADEGVLETVKDSLRAAAVAAGMTTTTTNRMVATAPAPLSRVGTHDESRWPPSLSDQYSTPAETEHNNRAADQQEQEASLLEYILRLRRP